jgi:hypothetical protein
MLAFANLLLIGASAVLLLIAATARPIKPEGFMGFHLITIPVALVMTLGLALGISSTWQVPGLPAWTLYASLPAYLLALTAMPFACFDRRGRYRAKGALVAAVVGTALCVNGAMLHPHAQLAGGITVLAIAAITYAFLAYSGLWPKLRRLVIGRARRRLPSDFEVQQGQWQREQWLRLPRDADLVQLLQFTRAFDAEVQSQCLARIRDLPERDRELVALLATEHAPDALHYITHHYPGSRGPIAAGVAGALDAEHAVWMRWIKANKRPEDIRRPLMNLLDCGTAVLLDGGAVKESMQRWQQLLAGTDSMADLAREIQRYLKKAR